MPVSAYLCLGRVATLDVVGIKEAHRSATFSWIWWAAVGMGTSALEIQRVRIATMMGDGRERTASEQKL
jgi:hypothetical protein